MNELGSRVGSVDMQAIDLSELGPRPGSVGASAFALVCVRVGAVVSVSVGVGWLG